MNTSTLGKNDITPAGGEKNEVEVQGKSTEAEQELHKIRLLVSTTKYKNSHYTPVLLGNVNVRLVKAKFYSLRIILDPGASFLIELGKHTKKYVTKRPIR